MSKSTENDGLNAMMQNGMGLGMGLHMGNAFAGGLNQMNANQMVQPTATNAQPVNTATAPAGELMPCPGCQAMIKKGSKFCPECGQKIEVVEKKRFCTGCGKPIKGDAKFCPECGTKIGE